MFSKQVLLLFVQKPSYIDLLSQDSQSLVTADGISVQVWRMSAQPNAATISDWARHLREQYCTLVQLDNLRGKTTRYDYLTNTKFPDRVKHPGPIVRSGDVSEILVADFIEWRMNGYWIPRLRWDLKAARNESGKGTDIIAFKIISEGIASLDDELFLIEVKAQLSAKVDENLQNAISHSAKDLDRLAESLNYTKQRFLERVDEEQAAKVGRFQNFQDNPFRLWFGAAACYCTSNFDEADIASADATQIERTHKKVTTFVSHVGLPNLRVFAFIGIDFMKLITTLYDAAATEA